MISSVLLLPAYFLPPNAAIRSPMTPLATSRAASTYLTAAAADLEALGVKGLPIEKTVKGLQMFTDQKLKYQQLLFLAKKLPDMDDSLMIDDNRVPGCLSVVYVHATQTQDGTITYKGTSDAQLTKGLVALLVNGLSGCTADQIAGLKPEFIEATGLQQSLTPGRNNVSSPSAASGAVCAAFTHVMPCASFMPRLSQGFLNMLAMMKKQAAAFDGDSADAAPPPPPPPPPPSATRTPQPRMLDVVDVTAAAAGLGPIGTRMVSNLAAELAPQSLELVDESDQHAGHAGAKGFDGESHFALTIITDAFEGVRSLKRHQMVYAAVGDDMPLIHALSINARAPGEQAKDA